MKQPEELDYYDNKKPLVHINALILAMASSSKEITVEKNKTVYFNKNNGELCHMLLDGVVVVKDSNSRKVIVRIEAPFFFGFTLNKDTYLQTVSDCTFKVVESKIAADLIRKESLWEHLYFLSRRMASYAYKKERSLSEHSASQQICSLLKILAEESDEMRYTTPVVQYLLDNSSLGRSTIFGVLAELKARNHVEIQRGILIRFR